MSLIMPQSCRCCLTERSDRINVFLMLNEFSSQICDLLVDCGGIIISEHDPFPKSICSSCLTDLTNAVRFRERCLDNEQNLKRIQLTAHEHHEPDGIFLVHNSGEKLPQIEEDGPKNDMKQEEIAIFDELPFQEPQPTVEPEIYSKNESVTDSKCDEDSIDDSELCSVNKSVTDQPPSTDSKPDGGISVDDTASESLDARKRKFECEICGKIYLSKKALSGHLLTQHDIQTKLVRSKETRAKIQCEVCQHWFLTSSRLKAHMAMHTGERPYKCGICGETFAFNILRRHSLQVHGEVQSNKKSIVIRVKK